MGKFLGLVGLVGKDPNVTRGLLIDTGAAVNVHSVDWIQRFESDYLRPLGLWMNEYNQSTSITGVEGCPLGTQKAHRLPGGLRGYDAQGNVRTRASTFSSQELKGSCPALLSNHSLIELEAVLDFVRRTLTILVGTERITFDLILTKSQLHPALCEISIRSVKQQLHLGHGN